MKRAKVRNQLHRLPRAKAPVHDGSFRLFVPGDGAGSRRMRYDLPFTGKDGRGYRIEGHKDLRDDPGFDAWADATTLLLRIQDGAAPQAPSLASGIARISVPESVRQLSTLEVPIRWKKVIPDHAKYLEIQGCLASLNMVSDADYRAMLERMPLLEIATAIAESAGKQPVSCVFLGSGPARLEDRFLSLLMQRCELRSITAVDISAGLLVVGGRRLCDRLSQHPHVKKTMLHADFLTLPFESIFAPDGIHVLTMFGYTYCNLSDPDFLANPPMNRGDYVLLDVTLVEEPASKDRPHPFQI